MNLKQTYRISSRFLFSLSSVLLAVPGAAPMDAQVQGNTGEASPSVRQLSPITIRNLLREPGGLEACAKLAGHFVVNRNRHLFARATLGTLTDASSLILIGRVSDSKASLIEEGDSILTTYTIVPEAILKGSATGNIVVSALGGTITFPDGTSAQILTPETQATKVGSRYCFFLKAGNDGEKEFTNGEESIFALMGTNGVVQSAASQSSGPHPVVDEIKGMAPIAFITRVQALVAQPNLK